MKKPILIILLLVSIHLANAQQPVDTATANAINAVDPAVNTKKLEDENNGSNTFTAVEIEAAFAGPGTIFDFLGNNIRYPADAAKNRIQGKVIVQFIIQKNGEVANAKILRSVSPELDKEALRVINLSRWHPAIQNGRAVNVSFVIPISYKLPPIDTTAKPKPASDADLLNQPNQQPVLRPDFNTKENMIFTAVENPADYPGGSEKLYDYVNLYLKRARNQYEGQEVVQFVIEKDGSVSNLKVLRGINPEADALAITIMKNAKFNPGYQNGHAVRSYYTVPMKFTVQASE